MSQLILFTICNINNIDINTELTRIKIVLNHMKISKCVIQDRELRKAYANYDKLNDHINLERFYAEIEAELIILPLDLDSAHRILAISKITKCYLFVMFNLIGNEYYHPINTLYRKLSVFKYPFPYKNINSVTTFSLFFYMRSHGYLRFIKFALANFRFSSISLFILTNLKLPSYFLYLIKICHVSANLLIKSDFNKFQGNKKIHNCALFLSESPLHKDNNLNDSEIDIAYQDATKLANRIKIFLNDQNINDCKIIPHPRDIEFGNLVSKVTGFELDIDKSFIYKNIYSFPSNILISFKDYNSIIVIDYNENYFLAESVSRLINKKYLLIK